MMSQEARALVKLREFLIDNKQNELIKIKIREFYKQITYMQKRIKDQTDTKESKVEVLLNYWDKMFGIL